MSGQFVSAPVSRKLILIGVVPAGARTPKGARSAAVTVRDEIEATLIQSGYFEGAAFASVSIAVVYGDRDADEPTYESIQQNGELPLTIEVDRNRMIGAESDEVSRVFREIVVRALVHAGEYYNRPVTALSAARSAAPAAPSAPTRPAPSAPPAATPPPPARPAVAAEPAVTLPPPYDPFAPPTGDDTSDLASRVASVAHLRGDFVLRSGATSTDYFDKYQFESDPKLLDAIVAQLLELIPKSTEMLAGLELGGVPVATALSLRTGIPVVFVRKRAKEYGTRRLAEGPDVGGRRLCIVEDVVTSGGQVVESAAALRELGATVENALCVVDREAGGAEVLAAAKITLRSLFRRSDLERG